MIDKKEFRKKFLYRVASSKVTWIPFMLGLSMLTAMWTFDLGSPLTGFAAVVAMLAGVGIGITRIILQPESIAKEVMDEVKKTAEDTREAYLDRLYQELLTDDDPRTENMLQDLRVLMRAFREDQKLTGKTNDVLGIFTKVDELADGCIRALEQSLVHYRRLSELRSDAARTAFHKQRERVIAEVAGSIERLSTMHARIEELSIGNDDPSKALRSLNEELDQNLRIAETVEKRMRGFTDDTDGQEYEQHA